MDANTIKSLLKQYQQEHSNLDQYRDYLGISKIADCPRKIYEEYFDGIDMTDEAYRMSYAGYTIEHDVLLALLEKNVISKILKPEEKEITSDFDPRFRGHIDAFDVEGNLIEIKSVSSRKFDQVRAGGRALHHHFVQIQLYMRYGHFDLAYVIYRNRETFEDWIIPVRYMPKEAEKYEAKARRILQAIDAHQMPACECGRCHE